MNSDSNQKAQRDVFKSFILRQRGNYTTHDHPANMFDLNERTGRYIWRGMEARYEDFCAGAAWFSKKIEKALKGPTK